MLSINEKNNVNIQLVFSTFHRCTERRSLSIMTRRRRVRWEKWIICCSHSQSSLVRASSRDSKKKYNVKKSKRSSKIIPSIIIIVFFSSEAISFISSGVCEVADAVLLWDWAPLGSSLNSPTSLSLATSPRAASRALLLCVIIKLNQTFLHRWKELK